LRLSERRLDTLACTIPFLWATGYLAAVLSLNGRNGLLLALQDPGFWLFQVLFIPLSVLFFRRCISTLAWSNLRSSVKAGWTAVAVVLCIAVVVGAWADIRRAPYAPYNHSDAGRTINCPPLGVEATEIDCLLALRAEAIAGGDNWGNAEENITVLRHTFDALTTVARIPSGSDFIAEASLTGWYALTSNILGFGYAALLFLYLVYANCHAVDSYQQGANAQQRLNNLVAAFVLLTFWIPLRVFSEWINGYFSFCSADFDATIPIAAAVVVGTALITRLAFPLGFEKWWKVSTGSIGLIASTVLARSEELLFLIARRIVIAQAWSVWLALFIVLLAVFAMLRPIVSHKPPER